jgi:hypothetical protein
MNSEKTSNRVQWFGVALNILIILGFAGVCIVAGHAVAPIGVLLTIGLMHETAWGLPLAFGWLGITMVAIATFYSRQRGHGIAVLIGLTPIVASWAIFVTKSDRPGFALSMSVPFIASVLIRAYYLFGELKDLNADSDLPR